MTRAPGLRGYSILYLVFLYAPILILPIFAFNDATVVSFPLSGVTGRWFAEMWADRALWQALRTSLVISLSTAVIATSLGVLAARAVTRYRWPGKPGVMGLILVPLVLPEIIVAMSMLIVLNWMAVPLSWITVIFGHVLMCMPFAVTIMTSAFQSLDGSLEEAALDLGETQLSAFRLIALPLVMPGMISSFLISFTISIDEYIIASFIAGNDTVLSTYIYGQFRFPAKVPMVLALGTCLVTASVIILMIAEYFRRRGVARAGGKDSGGFL
ncbi:ABC transporter permease [Pseudogemmobacter sonorensis]|uniref:ABC transporter permease n=1 Tax=Pseudogemmobacter sonorensis TaxID=2989681 RepID=UPI0036AF2E4B